MACNELIRGINPNCEATRKPGGLNKRIYVGLLSDLSAVTFGSGNLVTALTFLSGPDTTTIVSITNGTAGNAVIRVADVSGIKVGTSVTVSGADGNQTSGGATINGQAFVVTAINGLFLTVDKEISGLTAATSGTLTFTLAKGLVKFIGKREKHNSVMALEVGENFNLRNHGLNLVAYYNTAAELEALDSLLDIEGAFMVVETNSGELEVWGMNKGTNFANFGLKASAIEGGSGTAIVDSNIYTLAMNGNHENLQLYFDTSTNVAPKTLTENIAVLDALVVV